MKAGEGMTQGAWRYVRRSNLDAAAWDQAISQSHTPLLYATSPWLDALTDRNWAAYVLGDYEQVFPFFPKSKLGISYVTQPFLCQQLGLFGKKANETEIPGLLRKLQTGRWKIDLMMHTMPSDVVGTSVRTNHLLPIGDPEAQVRSRYHRNVRRNIEKAMLAGLGIQQIESHTDILPFLVKHDQTSLLAHWQTRLAEAMHAYQGKGGSAWTVVKGDEMLAAAYCVVYGDRVYFLLCQSSPAGKQAAAMYLLIDHLLAEFAGGKYKLFDFTGSGMPSIARRNLGFGAVREEYWHYRWRWYDLFTR